MNSLLLIAGSLAVLGGAFHGWGGRMLVARALKPEMLPATRFGGPTVTKTLLHVTWHLTTVAFLAVGCGLLLAGSVLDGDVGRGIALGAAASATAFAAVVLALGGAGRSPRLLLRHPAPVMLTAIAGLAWLGAV